jgi:hypothetical protein
MSRFLRADAAGGLEFSEELVRTASGHFDVALVQHLAVPNLSIRFVDRGVTAQLAELTVLDISRNALASLAGLAPLARTLVRLDASYNNIVEVATLVGAAGDDGSIGAPFARLEVLRLQGNLVRDMGAVVALAKLPKLRAIYLREQTLKGANPVCGADDYAPTMARAFTPKCRCIDGHYFCHEDVNPRRLDDGGDNELTLPPTAPWVGDAFFAAAVTANAGTTFGSNSEAQVRRLLEETKAALAQPIGE